MAKILNLDELGKKEVRAIVIGGKEHEIKEMSVEDFIEVTKSAEKLEKTTDPAEQIQETVNMLQRALPTVDRKDLLALSFEKLTALGAFVRGDDLESIIGKQDGDTEGK